MIKKTIYQTVFLLVFSGLALAAKDSESNIAKEVYDHSWFLTQKTSRMATKLSEDLELVKLRFENVQSIRQNSNFLLDLAKEHGKNIKNLINSAQYLTKTLIPQLEKEVEAETVDRHEAALATQAAGTSVKLAVLVLEAQNKAQDAFVSILEKGASVAFLEGLLEMLQEIQQNSTRTAAAM